MNDNSLGTIQEAKTTVNESELDRIMQVHIDSGMFTKEQLAEMRKAEANRIKEAKKTEKQNEKNTTTVKDFLLGTRAPKKEKVEITNKNPLHSKLKPSARINKNQSFWDLEEEEGIGELQQMYPSNRFKFEATDITYTNENEIKEGMSFEKGSPRMSRDAIKVTAFNDDGSVRAEQIVEMDIGGFIKPQEGWDSVRNESYNTLTNFLDEHLTDTDIEKLRKNDEVNLTILKDIQKNNLTPTEEEYDAGLEDVGLLNPDLKELFKDEKVISVDHTVKTIRYGGHEDKYKIAKKQLTQENKNKSTVSGTAYVEPTEDEILQRTLRILQQDRRDYILKDKADKYIESLEDFDDWEDLDIIQRAREEGLTFKDREGKDYIGYDGYKTVNEFKRKVRAEMKKKYYKLKAAGRIEESKVALDYRTKELQLRTAHDNLMENDLYQRVNAVNAQIQDLNRPFEKSENDIKLDNGKIIPLEIWEQHVENSNELQPLINDFNDKFDASQKYTEKFKDDAIYWDLIRRNYDDADRFSEVMGYGFANLGATAVYGVPKFLTFGYSGGDDEMIRFKELQAKNRESFRKDVQFENAFEDDNFGRFMLQATADQIPIYATIATGSLGLTVLGSSVFGDKWAEMTMQDRASKLLPASPTYEKWFKSLGFSAAEIVLDYAITVPIMRNAKNMMFSGAGKAMLDNTTKSFIKRNAIKSLVFSPALESVSEGATQVAQNMIDGKHFLEGVDHAAFLGLTMGAGISYTGFTSGAITSVFSDHKQMQEVRDNITEMQSIANATTDLKEGLKFDINESDKKRAEQEIKDNDALLQELMDKNEAIIKEINKNVQNKIDPIAFQEFMNNEQLMESIKVRAQKILDGNLPQKTKNKQLEALLKEFNLAKASAKYFKDPKTFGSRWAFVLKDEKELNRLKDLAMQDLQKEGKQDPDDKKVVERARFIWAKEQVRISNGKYKNTKLAKNYTAYETKEEAATVMEDTIDKEIEVIKNSEISEKDRTRIIKDLKADKKRILAGIKDGSIYGLNRVPYNNLAGAKGKTADAISISIVESQARAERFETRTHEGGHQVFWNALQATGGNQIFTPMAEQILDWTKKNDKGMHKRIMLRTGGNRQGAAEVISVFLEEVGDGKFDVKKNKGFTNLWGLMSNDALTTTTGKDFNFNFAGETDVMNFLVTLGKKIKNGTLTRSDEAAIRKAFKAKADKKAKSQFSQVYQEVETFKEALSSKDPKTKRDAALMIAYTLENEVDRRLPVLEGINQEDKADIVNNFLFDEKRGLMGLLKGYDPKINDSVMGYLNSFVPRTKLKLLDARLMEFYKDDPRFGNIIQSMQQEGVTERVEKQGSEITVKTPKRERAITQDKVVLETFGETALQNEIRTDVVALGVEGVNTYLDVKKNTVSHRKFVGIKNAKGEVVKQIEITPEYKAKQKKLEVDAVKKYKKQGLTEKEAKKRAKKDHGIVELKSLRIPTGKYYPILEKVAKMYGVDPLRLIREQDLTTTMRKSSQDYILSKRDEHIVSLPEGTTRAGNPTGIANTALGKAFFKAGGRMSFKTTGTGKGLKEQAKQRIDPSDYLAIFGLIPRNRINNTSVDPALRSQIIQTAVLAINQGVRQEKDALELIKERVDQIKDGKAVTMYSENAIVAFKQTYIQPIGVLGASLGLFRVPNKKVVYGFKKDGTPKTYSTRDLDAPFIYKDKDGKIVETGQNYRDAGVSVINNFLKSYPQFRQLIRITTTGGKKGGFFQTVGNFNNLIDNANVDQAYISRTKYGGDKAVYSKAFHEKLIKGQFNQENKDRLPLLRDFYKAIESHLQENPRDVWMFEEMLLDTGKQQNVFTRILAPFVFYPVDANKNPIFNQPIKEEHTDPQNLIGKALLSAALQGKVNEVWKVVGKSYMQGGILDSQQSPHDSMIDDAGYSTSMPEVYYEKIVPRLLDGSLNLPDGYSSIVRLAASGIDLNMYYLHNEGKTIAEYFGVEGMEVSRANDLIIKQLAGEVSLMFSRAVNKSDIKNNISENKRLDKAIAKARTTSYSKAPKGITVLDFDDTLATSKSLVISTSPDGVVRKLTAEEFATEGADLLDQGWTHDFSEFSKVVDGKVASLFKKAMKLQGKFGPENMFVLTARPAGSAPAIFKFLKANGLNIPLKNITGLANSTAEAKALWMADKVGEGYNDFYFADDALQNVQAVSNMLDQFDVKSKVQQAKVQFSQDASSKFNDIIQETTGIESQKVFSEAQAKIRGQKSKYKSIIPPSAQDFAGLLYNFLGKGKKGEQDMAFFKKALIDPFARGINELNAARQASANDYKNLLKQFPEVKKLLNKKIEGTDYTHDQAVRIYLWNKAGFEIPGLSKRDLKTVLDFVENNSKVQAFADTIGLISKKEDGYSAPGDYWLAENIKSDLLSDGSIGDARAEFLAEWQQNADIIFSPENLNKIEAIYGSNFREALEDILYRMKTGRNRPAGGGRLMNIYTNWVNNSVGAIMFFNMRSALLQTISATNYINWSDNNPLKAAAAFANQKQYWKDFSYLFNSDYLKQRRAGNQRGVNEAELSAAVAGAENKAKAAITWLLKKGFLPTQIADSFAIASGGATFYRNRIKALLKEGMTQEQAEKQAFLDFQETTEVAQQSARPDMISQQQASPLGKLILAFQNTPMQYARIMNKAARDLANGRGDSKTHMSKIIYYGFVQSIIFGALQSALFASLDDEDEEKFNKKKERILNGMADSVLSGIGYGGKAVSTIKNTLITFLDQRKRGYNADHTYTILQLLGFSPPIGSKLRKIYSSIQTDKFNKDVFLRRGFTLDNPIWSAIGNVVEGVTNVPLGRLSQKMLNIDNALDANNKWWQRVALVLGWNTWDLGIRDADIEGIKADVKKEGKKKRKTESQKDQININKQKQKQEKKEGKKVTCAAISKSGNRCKTKVEPGSSFCTIHEEVKQNKSGKKSQCKKIKSNKKRCGMQTSSASGYCYYHD